MKASLAAARMMAAAEKAAALAQANAEKLERIETKLDALMGALDALAQQPDGADTKALTEEADLARATADELAQQVEALSPTSKKGGAK